MQRSLPDFERQGVAVFAISHDPVDVLAGFSSKHGITYPLLSDTGSRVIRELGLLNEHVDEHHAFYGIAKQEQHQDLPYPGAFLLDEQGRVTEKRFQSSYRERETGSGILEQGFHGKSSQRGAEAAAGSAGISVRASLDSDTYHFFQRLWLSVEIKIEPGLHLYGRPIPDGYFPLSIEVAPLDGVEVGAVRWPEPKPFRVPELDEQFFVYEGDVRVSLPVTFTRRDAGDQTLEIAIRYQACSTRECFAPNTVRLRLPVKAAALVT